MILLSRAILKRHPGAAILGEVKCSQTLYDDIAKHGGRPIIWKTGHSLIKTKMKEEHALLAGEMSGHLFFADRYFGYDDAIYASLRLLEILAETASRCSELLADVPETFTTPELRVDCAGRDEVRRRAQSARALPRDPQRLGCRRCAHQVRWRLGSCARVEHAARAGAALRGGNSRAPAARSATRSRAS